MCIAGINAWYDLVRKALKLSKLNVRKEEFKKHTTCASVTLLHRAWHTSTSFKPLNAGRLESRFLYHVRVSRKFRACSSLRPAQRRSESLSSHEYLPSKMALSTEAAFCASLALRKSFFSDRNLGAESRCEALHFVQPRVKAAGIHPTMSLTNDLIIKGLEFAAATFVGNTVASQQAKKKPDNFFFRLGKKRRKQPKEAKISKENVDNIVSELLKVVDRMPEFIEKGGPEGKRWVKLAICIIIDLIGSGSLGIPIVGDMLDLVTAPVSAAMLQALFGSTLVTMAGFAEEILPGTDGIPTATLAWFAENYGYLKSNSEERSGS